MIAVWACLVLLLAACGATVACRQIATIRTTQASAMRHVTLHDELTGLPNRQSLRRWLQESVSEAGKKRHFSLLYLNLDRFKIVNDLYGHRIGDLLLVQVAARIRRVTGANDLVGRLGGDEFIILHRAEDLAASAAGLAGRLLAAIDVPFEIEGQTLGVSASIGIANGPHDEASLENVLRQADTALRQAKAEGGEQYNVFDTEQDRGLLARREIECNLRRAIENQELTLHYQPLFECGNGALYGFEALVRWQHPTRGLVSPAEFIPFAEKSGLINRLGLWVLETACLEAACWPADLTVSVNLSPMQFRQAELVGSVRAALAAAHLAPERLELEITESALIDHPGLVASVITALKADGIKFAIDDFGTGYSSLSYLRRFAFDRIKIDRSFVQSMESDADSAAIIRAVIGLGHSLRIDVLAEGVETERQFEMLCDQGCDQVQGFLCGRPMPEACVSCFIELREERAREKEDALF
jgi:diguanylate cyclase (GGDEF)-like protein